MRIGLIVLVVAVMLPSLGAARESGIASSTCDAYERLLADARIDLRRGDRERALEHLRLAREALEICGGHDESSEEVFVATSTGQLTNRGTPSAAHGAPPTAGS